MNKQLRELLAKRQALLETTQAITKAAETAALELTAEQKASIDANLESLGTLAADIKRLEAIESAARSVVVVGANVIETRANIEDDPKRGWQHFGEYLGAVRAAAVGSREIDDRLLIGAGAATTFSNENVGVEGGFLVPTEFSTEIAKIALEDDHAFLPMTEQMPVKGNSITFPSDETTPWGTNGIRAYWAAEAALATATKPIIKPNTMRLAKLIALVPVTDELLEDSSAIAAYLTWAMGRSIRWKINDAIINGTGAGQPLGLFNSAALVTIAKEAAQATLTFDANNFAKMYAAMPVDYLANAKWLITPDALPKLITLTLGNFAIWTPPTQGIQGAPGGFLLGKPIIPTQTCQAFSSKGDVFFTNFDAYRTISKDGIEIAESMHLYFDADQTAYRATFRMDGQPTFKQTIVQARGAQPLSPYVTLAAR